MTDARKPITLRKYCPAGKTTRATHAIGPGGVRPVSVTLTARHPVGGWNVATLVTLRAFASGVELAFAAGGQTLGDDGGTGATTSEQSLVATLPEGTDAVEAEVDCHTSDSLTVSLSTMYPSSPVR